MDWIHSQQTKNKTKKTPEVFLPRLLLSYRRIPPTGRLESQSALMGSHIRSPLTISYSINETMWYKNNKESNPKRAEFIMQKWHNTSITNRVKRNSILAFADQIRPQGEYEDQNEEEISTVPSVNDLLEQSL